MIIAFASSEADFFEFQNRFNFLKNQLWSKIGLKKLEMEKLICPIHQFSSFFLILNISPSYFNAAFILYFNDQIFIFNFPILPKATWNKWLNWSWKNRSENQFFGSSLKNKWTHAVLFFNSRWPGHILYFFRYKQ